MARELIAFIDRVTGRDPNDPRGVVDRMTGRDPNDQRGNTTPPFLAYWVHFLTWAY